MIILHYQNPSIQRLHAIFNTYQTHEQLNAALYPPET